MVLCGVVIALMAVPSHQTRARRTCFTTFLPGAGVTSTSSSSRSSPFRGVRGGSRGCVHPRFHSTVLAASKNKNKSKKKKNSGTTANKFGSSSGGFGVASAPTASAATKPTIEGESRAWQPSTSSRPPPPSRPAVSAPAGQLPDDDFATFPPLSPDTLKSVMGVDVFDMPPRGIPASERGQEQALPSQVLECIRNRHGLEEFAGGRRLLDPEYAHDKAADGEKTREGGDGNAACKGLLFPGLRLLHAEPPVIGVDDFFTPEECDEYVSRSVSPTPAAPAAGAAGTAGPHMQRSATLGADVDAVAQVGMREASDSSEKVCGRSYGFVSSYLNHVDGVSACRPLALASG